LNVVAAQGGDVIGNSTAVIVVSKVEVLYLRHINIIPTDIC